MEVVVLPTPKEVGELGATLVASVLAHAGPEPVLGVATGSSPLGIYSGLAERIAAGELDLTGARVFALDEYVGIAQDHPESYTAVVDRTVTRQLGLDPDRVGVPDGFAQDLRTASDTYEEQIAAAGGIDIQILGIGSNGHIGFNEPGTALTSRTHVTSLTQQTREDNSRFFDSIDEVPAHAITQGLGTILDARKVLLVATGSHKAHAVAAVVEGPLTARRPGSVLQMHQHATIIVDESAATGLQLKDHFQESWQNRLDWQRW